MIERAAVSRPQDVAVWAPPRTVGFVPVADLIGVALSCLVVVLVFSPVLFGGRTLSTAAQTYGTNGSAPAPGMPVADHADDVRPDPGASAWQFEPWAEVTDRAYAAGELPLWNQYQAAGAPLGANMQSAVFDPLLVAVNLHPTPLTWDLSVIAAFLIGAAAAYVFGRILGLAVLPSIVTSVAFSLGGWFLLYSNNDFSRSYVYLPLLFLLVELVLRSRRLLPVFGLAVAIAGNIYVGMPEASFFVLGSTAVYAVVRLVQERQRARFRGTLVRLAGGGVLGLLLAAPLLLLFLQYEPLSFNVHKSGAGHSAGDPQWAILNWLVPFYSTGGVTPIVRGWFGVAVGVSVLAAISGRSETKRLHAWLFLALGAVVLVKTYDFGVLDWVGRLPIFELVAFEAFAAGVASFAFAVLAGIGVQVLARRDLRLRRFLTLLSSSLVLLALFVLTGDRRTVISTAARHHAETVWGRGILFGAIAIAAVVFGARFGRRWAPLLLAAAIVCELVMLAPFSVYAKRADPYRVPGWMGHVRTGLGDEPLSRVFGLDAKLYPNTAGALGLHDIRALDALYVERYLRYVKTFLAPNVYDRFTGTELPVLFRSNPMFDALSVRAVLSEKPLATTSGFRLIGIDPDTRVYENTNAYPRAWLVHRLHVVEHEDESFAFLEARSHQERGAFVVDRFDPRREAVVEHRGTAAPQTLRLLQKADAPCAANDRDRVEIERYAGDSVTLRVQAGCAGLLVLPDAYYPGWKASLDGRRTAIYPTDGAFRGVLVPKGRSQVEFRYEPRRFDVGIALAVAGLATFLGICLVSGMRRRNRPLRWGRPPDETASG